MYRKSKEAMSLAAVSAAALALASCSGRTEAVKPNIIVFLVDDMGLMDTSVPFLTDSVGRPVRHALNSWYRTRTCSGLPTRVCVSPSFTLRV